MEENKSMEKLEEIQSGLQESGLLTERLELVIERIAQIREEHFAKEHFGEYFKRAAEFLLCAAENYEFVKRGGFEEASLAELQERNREIYWDVTGENYEKSFANPSYAARMLGEEYGSLLAAIYADIRLAVGFAYDAELLEVVSRAELFAEIHTLFSYEWEEEKRLPSRESIRKIYYWHAFDYADCFAARKIRYLVVPSENPAYDIVMKGDLTDERYLYRYGEYVSENELLTAKFLAQLDEETINTMADTYTEGFRIGFIVTGKDLSKKKTVDIMYRLGFERMVRRAVENFKKMGLQPILRRGGYEGGCPNRQYEFDHKDDIALILDRNYVNRRLESTQTAYEKYRRQAAWYGGPAAIETFGERDFDPLNKPERIRMSAEQNSLWVEFISKNGEIRRKYINEDERSYTIIAFPVPEIKEVLPESTDACFMEFFKEIIKINTLDYELYRKIQQNLIDVLDLADYCQVKGMGKNETDMRVNLWKLKDPSKETIFENCVADVNIPVGEVFTSPVLEGTRGVLHVSHVFLEGLEFRDLKLTFEDGKIVDYTCSNFGTEEENKEFISENILFRHKTLPIGEFAIGTNTTAYVTAKKYGVEKKLPILIAEKTGPHFAVGDTCYSHSEEVRVYNPDGKEIVARENSCSLLRKEKPGEGYFNCHTDITIPFDELAFIDAVRKDGSRVRIIEEGRFVLPGTEELNRAFSLG